MKKKGLKALLTAVLQYVIMIAVIMCGQCIWIRINFQPGRYVVLSMVLSMATSVLLVTGKLERNCFIKTSILAGLLMLYTVLSPFKGDPLLIPLRVTLPLFLLILYLRQLWRTGGVYGFVEKYSNIVVFLSLVSLVLYVFGTLLHLLPSREVVYYWADEYMSCKSYGHFLYETQREMFFGRQFIRNCGIFCEAPSYAVPLVMSLFFEVFFQKRKNRLRIVVLLLTILTTFSTKALLIVVMIFALKLLRFRDIRKKNARNLIRMATPFIILIAAYICNLVLEQKIDSNSFVSRMDNLQSTLKAFRDHPILGVGASNEKAVSAYSLRVLKRYGFSVGATLLLAEGGLYLTSIFMSSFIHALLFSKDRYLAFSTGVVYLTVLFSSNITFFLSTIFILALGFSVPPKRRALSGPKQDRQRFIAGS